jgi:hypothetical protein
MHKAKAMAGSILGHPWIAPGYGLGLMQGSIEDGFTLCGQTVAGLVVSLPFTVSTTAKHRLVALFPVKTTSKHSLLGTDTSSAAGAEGA